MKTDWVIGDTFYFCKHSPRKERGTLVDKVPFGKYTVENVNSDCVESGIGYSTLMKLNLLYKLKESCNENI